MRLTYDWETTGLANFKAPPEDPSQPRGVQLGALLKDDDGNVVSEINLIVKPEGFTIPEAAANVHGITTEKALKYGLSIKGVLKLFIALVKMSDLLVGHNQTYDDLVMRGELIRAGFTDDLALFQSKPRYCTMQASTDILKIPGKYGKSKWPNLQEAHKHFFGVGFDGAHDASADVRATDHVYEGIQAYLAKLREPAVSTV